METKTLKNSIRSLREKFLPLMTLLLGLGLMSGSFAQRNAEARRFDTIPSIRLQNTGSLQGRYIHVLYFVGQRLPIEVTASPKIRVAREVQRMKVTGNEVTFPSVTIEHMPLIGTYNLILIVVSDSSEILWVNPEDNVQPNYQQLRLLNRAFIEQSIRDRGQDQVIELSL